MYQWFACFSWCILTKHRYYLPNTHTTTSKDIVFRADFSRHTPSFFLYFLLVFSPFYTEVWHLWQQKNNIAVGMRAPMRIYACTRETLPENSPSTFFLIFSSSSFFSSSFLILPHFPLLLFWGIQYLQVLILLYAYYRFEYEQRKKCTFPWFFHALGQYRPIYK